MKQAMRTISAVLSVAVFLAILFSVTVSADPYTIIDLGTLGGSESEAIGINESGQVVGSSTVDGDASSHAFLFTNGQMLDLGTLGGTDSYANAINAAGQVVGWSSVSSEGIGGGFLYQDGQMVTIVPSGETFGISDWGIITGCSVSYIYYEYVHSAFTYDGSVHAWPGMFGLSAWPKAINNVNQIIGYYTTQTGDNHAFLYCDGSMTDLGTMGAEHSYASGINSFGHVAGYTYTPYIGETQAFFYTNGTMIDIGTLGGSDAQALAINDFDEIVGLSQDASGTYRAFLYSDGEMVALQDLIPQDSGWELEYATGINNSGQIVGLGYINGHRRAFLMTPTQCDYALGASRASFGDGGGTDSLHITTQTGCAWKAASNLSWVNILSGAAGTGNGIVTYSVAPNTETAVRTGTITIAGELFTISQDAAKQYTLTVNKAGEGSGSVTSADSTINCGTTCSAAYASGASAVLTATPSNGSVFSGWSGGGCSGTAKCTIAVKSDTAVTALFSASSCTYSIDVPSMAFNNSAATDRIKVTTQSGCAWAVANNPAWVTITSGGSGTGSGTVTLAVSANTDSSSRSGTLTVAGKPVVITQAASTGPFGYTFCANDNQRCSFTGTKQVAYGAGSSYVYKSFTGGVDCKISSFGSDPVPGTSKACYTQNTGCTFGVSETSKSFASTAATGTIALTASASTCSWTASSNASWLTITSSKSGKGSVSLNYSLTANTGTTARTGIITIGGKTFTVTQNGTYMLTVTKTGTGSGTLKSSDSKINCGTTCSSTYTSGTTVYLTAIPNTGAIFTGWSGGGCSGTDICSVPMSAATTVTGTFSTGPCSFTLSPMSKTFTDQSDNSTIVVTPSSSSCAWTATSTVPWTTITSGASGTGNGSVAYAITANTSTSARTGTITLGGQTVTITQAGVPQYTLTASKGGNGSGTITSSDGNINCGTACQATYFLGASVSLNATADAGSVFTGWSGGGCSGTGVCTPTLHVNTPVMATFTPCTYTLSSVMNYVSGSGAAGAVEVTALTGSCGWTATSNVPWISIVSGGSGVGNGTVNYSVAANLSTEQRMGTLTIGGQLLTVIQGGLPQYALSVSRTGTVLGTITSTDGKINCGTTCSSRYMSGTAVTLTAVPSSGGAFTGWSGGGCSGTGPCSMVITNDTTAFAAFAEALQLAVTHPVNGSTLNSPYTTVSGSIMTLSGLEAGVTVNGVAATVFDTQFVANGIELVPGSNTLTITARDTMGQIVSQSVTVNHVPAAQYIRLTATPQSGIAPLQTTIRVDGSFSVSNPVITVSGPAPAEIITSTNPNEYVYRMTTEGIYYFTTQAIGPDGLTYQDTFAVTVMNKNALDTLLKQKWDGMKGALAAGNADGAIKYIAQETKPIYATLFNAMSGFLPTLAQQIQGIAFVYSQGPVMVYRTQKTEVIAGSSQEVTYLIYFVADEDGIWKIYRY